MTKLREVPKCRELKRETYDYSEINLRFLILSCLIFESSVERGIPSFAAAPCGLATFPNVLQLTDISRPRIQLQSSRVFLSILRICLPAFSA